MHIDWWTLTLQAINVLILVWLLARFLFRPVMSAIVARQAAANLLLADAGAAKSAAKAQEATLKAQTDAFGAEAERRQTELQADIAAERSRLLDQVKAEAKTIAAQTTGAAQAERTRMKAELEDKAGVLAGQMAAKLLQRLPPGEMTNALFRAMLDTIQALPEEDRLKLVHDGPLIAVTAGPLDDEARTRFSRDLATTLPGISAADFTVDPTLIAGFELRGPHMVLRNSWRGDLDTMLSALKEDHHARLG
jgi:F-type H+-transporting ATPase subunit b